jgi:hypothetical protein
VPPVVLRRKCHLFLAMCLLLDSLVGWAKRQPETLVKKPEDLVDLGESFG